MRRFKMENGKLILILAIFILGIVGCENQTKIAGFATAILQNDVLRNGETTTLTVNGKNTGNTATQVYLNIAPEDPNKIKITYPGSLEDTLQPNEDIGSKIVTIQAFTDYTSTKYWVNVQLVNKADNTVLDEKTAWITVNK